jgi:hypothetical protein
MPIYLRDGDLREFSLPVARDLQVLIKLRAIGFRGSHHILRHSLQKVDKVTTMPLTDEASAASSISSTE